MLLAYNFVVTGSGNEQFIGQNEQYNMVSLIESNAIDPTNIAIYKLKNHHMTDSSSDIR